MLRINAGGKSPEKTRGGMRWRWWRWWWRWWCAPGLLRSISTFPPQCAESDSAAAAADTGSEGAGQGERAARIKADREREGEREACRWGPMLWLTGTPTHTFCLRHIIYPMRRVTLRLLPLTLHWPTVISCDLWMCGGIKTPLTPPIIIVIQMTIVGGCIGRNKVTFKLKISIVRGEERSQQQLRVVERIKMFFHHHHYYYCEYYYHYHYYYRYCYHHYYCC